MRITQKIFSIFLSRFKNILLKMSGILIGLLLAGCIFFSIEGICYLLNASKKAPVRSEEGTYTQGYFQYDKLLGYGPHSDTVVSSTVKYDGQTVYNISYSIDSYYRRRTPVSHEEARKRFALFFGGSYTIGQGVNAHETLPAYFAKYSPEYMPYNYGFHGYGPQQMLAKLQSQTFKAEIPEQKGVLLYTYVPGHVDRAIGAMYVYNGWGKDMPYYTVDADGTLSRKGSFRSSRPISSFFYRLLGKSQFIKYFKVSFPLKRTRRHYALTVRLFQESCKLFEERFQSEGCYVVLYPGRYDDKFLQYLKQTDIIFFDYSDAFHGLPKDECWIPHDGHPSAKSHQRVARELAKDLAALSGLNASEHDDKF